MKRIFLFLLTLVLTLNYGLVSFAEEAEKDSLDQLEDVNGEIQENASTEENMDVSQETKELIDYYFLHRDTSEIFDNNYNDISQSFFSNNLEYYENQNYTKILENIYQSVSFMSNTEISNKERGFSKTVKDNCTQILYSKSGIDHRIMVKYIIKGSFNYNPNDGKIISAYNPTLESVEVAEGKGLAWDFSFVNKSTSCSVSKDKFYATYTGSFTVNSIFTYDAIKENIYFGSCRGTLKTDADGHTTASPRQEK